MTVPVDSNAPPTPGQEDTSQSGTRSIPGFPSDRSLERFQRYLAPLQRLGNQRVAWIGAALLFIGVFLPAKAVSIPYLNVTVTASFWNFSKFEALVLILVALSSAWLATIHDYKWLWVAAGISLLFMAIEFIDALTSSYFHPSWGWVVLFLALSMLVAAAALKRDPTESQGNAVGVVRGLAARAASGH